MTSDQCPSAKLRERPGEDIGHWNLVIHWSLRHWALVISRALRLRRSRSRRQAVDFALTFLGLLFMTELLGERQQLLVNRAQVGIIRKLLEEFLINFVGGPVRTVDRAFLCQAKHETDFLLRSRV